jgi:hypothetical protein
VKSLARQKKIGSEHPLVELEKACVILEKINWTIMDRMNTKAPELFSVLTWMEMSEVFPSVAFG